MTSSHVSRFKLHKRSERPVDQYLGDRVRVAFGPHPFAAEISKDKLVKLLPEYFAMSQAFPYLLAGSQKEFIFDAIQQNRGLPRDVEMTSVVANFICWDETGGHSRILEGGNAALPHILDTENFHSKLFRRDASRLLGRAIQPNYSTTTKRYLRTLYHGLASRDPIARCAHMVAFELHAAEMIQSLWTTLVNAFDVRPEDLDYFRIHVGGYDPAEKYHAEMTSRLVSELVPADDNDRFLDVFDRAYSVSLEWCRDLIGIRQLDGDSRPQILHRGRCHCGSVKFSVRAPEKISAVKCNCSICRMSGFLHMLVPGDNLSIECGEEILTTYRFNKNIAQHTFCRVCGVKPFYRPRSNPSGFSVNVQCLDGTTIESVSVEVFDGEEWEQAICRMPGALGSSLKYEVSNEPERPPQ